MRIGGLATGIDTESIIRDMMNANRMPLNKITQKKQYTEWQLDNYRSTNLDLKKFSDNIFSNMILSDSFRQKTVDVSNPDAIGVKNLSSTGDFSGTIRVGQLAKGATMQSREDEGVDLKGKSATSTLADLGLATEDGEIMISAIGADREMANETFKYESTDTLQSVLNKINKGNGVTAFFDTESGKIGMTAKNGGTLQSDGSEIEVSSGTLADGLGLSGVVVADEDKGKNAIFEFNGMIMERSSNKFEINGFEFTLKDTTTTVNGGVLEAGGPSITFSSAPDTDKILDNVVKFVDEYNTLIETLNAQIREPKYRDFHPLSAEEKADMKEKEIELWEEKAMSGTLRNDPMISSMLSQMRTALMGSVGGDGEQTLKAIGIKPSDSYLDNGKLIIDEEALRAAIADDPDKVHQLFSKGTDESAVEDQGFARRLRGIVQATETKITERAGKASSTNDNFTIGRSLIDMDKQITRFEDRLKMTEDRLWRQFTAMEVAIQKANAQSASLMNSFGGGM